MPGRPPKPTALKLLQGRHVGVDSGGRPIRQDEPKPTGKAEPPKWLSRFGRELWDEWAPVYEAMGCLTSADTLMFSNWMEAQARLVVAIKADQPISNETLRLAQSYAVQFGATPSARARIHQPKPERETKLSEFTDAREA